MIAHATGEPRFAVVDGRLVPFAEWQSARARPPATPRAMTLQSADGSFAAGIEVQ